MNAKQRRQVECFFARVERAIDECNAVADQDGIRRTARDAAAQRAADFRRDLDYLRATYTSHRVMVGEGAGA